MPLESATYIDQLVPANPVHGDNVNAGDAHLRLIKSVLQNNFPNFTAAALASTNAAIDAVVGAFYTAGSSLVSLATSIVTLAASLTVNNNLAVGGTLGAVGNTTLGGTLGVTGNATLAAALSFLGPLTASGGINTQTGTTYTIGATDFIVLFTNVAGCTVTLPAASSSTGRLLLIVAGSTLFNASDSILSASANMAHLNYATIDNKIIGSDVLSTALLASNGTNWQIVVGT